MNQPQLAPSILSADFGNLHADCQAAIENGIDWLHIDVMDGHFVPNISFGTIALKGLSTLHDTHPFTRDVHLMIQNPENYIDDFAKAGADIITVHQETCTHLHRTIQQIHDTGAKAGIALNPATSLTTLDEILPLIDLVLIMTVNPGFGGQSFIPSMLPKIAKCRAQLNQCNPTAWLQVDGGIKHHNIQDAVNAGADSLVAGSAVFNYPQGIKASLETFCSLL